MVYLFFKRNLLRYILSWSYIHQQPLDFISKILCIQFFGSKCEIIYWWLKFCIYLLRFTGRIANQFADIMMTSSNGNIFRVTRPFVGRIHRSPVNSPHKGQWRGALIFSLICAWMDDWINREAGDLRRHRDHYDVTVRIGSSLANMNYQAIALSNDDQDLRHRDVINSQF